MNLYSDQMLPVKAWLVIIAWTTEFIKSHLSFTSRCVFAARRTGKTHVHMFVTA